MPTSEARIAANRANALRSTGPRTEEGKARSRANALKHGLTGEGIALPVEDAPVVARRFAEFQAQFGPETPMGAVLVQRVAMLSVRLDRGYRQESAAIAAKVLRAEADFDEARRAEADHLLHWIGATPATNHRRLLATPEGVDRLVAEWRELKRVAEHPGEARWDYANYMKADHLCGRDSSYVTEFQALSFALKGEHRFLKLGEGEGEGLDEGERRRSALRGIAGLIDAKIAELEAHRETLDLASIAAERAGAADRALFDPSKEATLARKYEAAAERGMFRAIKELRQVEQEAAVRAQAEPPGPAPEAEPAPEPDPDDEPLAWFFPAAIAAESAPPGGPIGPPIDSYHRPSTPIAPRSTPAAGPVAR